MKYSELLKYHENDIFIFRKGRDITINTQKTLVLWYSKISKNRRFEIKYVQRIPLTLRIYDIFGFTHRHTGYHSMRIYSNRKYVRFDALSYGEYDIAAYKNSIFNAAFSIDHLKRVKYVDEVQDFVRDWLNQECMDVHTLHKEFLKNHFNV